MGDEKIFKAVAANIAYSITRGVRFFYRDDPEFIELKCTHEITQLFLEMDDRLIIDSSHARPPLMN